jgi:hypothetical protein
MVAQVNITQENDADFYQTFAYLLPDGITPISLVGATFKMSIRRSAGDAGVLLSLNSTLSSSGQISLVDAPNGRFSVWILQAALVAMPLGIFAHSLVASLPTAAGVPARTVPIFNGSFTTVAGPSR